MPGIRARLGGFADRVIQLGRKLGHSLGETLRIIQPIAPDIDAEQAARDWGSVSTSEALTPDIIKLKDDEFVPRDLFVTSDIPWADRYAYQVTIFGRDNRPGKTRGQFRNQVFDMTTSSRMSIEDVKMEAMRRFGGYEQAQFSEIWSTAVTGAWKSSEVEW